MNFPPDLVDRMAALPKCMPHFHLPLQAGSDKILRQMRRRYTRAEFSRLVEKLRTSFPEVGITTDVMVGFPGETDANFEDSLQYVEEIGFSQLHVFRYSPRRGTPAADYADHVPPHVSSERSKGMIALGKQLGINFRKRMLGKTMKVLIEDSREGVDRHLAGFTENYLRVLTDLPDSEVNRVLPARLTALEGEFNPGGNSSHTTQFKLVTRTHRASGGYCAHCYQ